MTTVRRSWWQRATPTQRVVALVAGLAGIDLAVLAAVWDEPPIVEDVRLPLIALIAVFAFVEWRVIHIQFRAEASSFSLLEIPLVLGLLYASPRELIVAAMVGMGIGLALARRQALVKVAFNVANIGFYCGVSWLVLDILGGGPTLDRSLWLAVFVATIVGSTLSVGCILVAITLTEGPPDWRPVLRLVGFALAMSTANTALGLVAALLLPSDALGIALLLVPGAMVLLAFQMFASERAQRERVEFLYRSSRLLDPAGAENGTKALLEAVKDMFRAEVAALAMLPDDDQPGSAAVAVADLYHEQQLDDDQSTRLALAFDGLDTAAMVDPDDAGHLPSVVRAVGGRDAIVAPMATDDRDLGLLIAANRLGDVTSFTDDDLQVLAALAAQSGVLLHNDRLEQALTELRELERRLAHQATHDTLTGLPNRSLFTRQLDEIAVGDDPFAVLFVDLDDFKLVNDTRGHADGDRLLVALARRLEAVLRPVDVAARLGGDEFAVLIRDHPIPREVAERIVATICEPVDLGDGSVHVGCSVGIARSDDTRDPQQLLQHADVAMYQAKRGGKRGVVEYAPGIDGRSEIGFRANLRDAISAGRLVLHYQPVVDLGSGRICGLEALVRWHSPDRGLLLPGEFIAQAENDGFIIPIDRWVLEQATDDLGRLADAHHDLFVAVNVSARHLQAPDLVEHIAGLQPSAAGFDGRLLLEVTETALMGEIERSRTNVEAMRDLGARIALDDFGTGYSSIGYLREFHIDVLKLARPFVTAGAETPKDREFVRAMIELGHALGLSIVGEGVERAEESEMLTDLGCAMAQGFFFARPMPLDDVLDLLDLLGPGRPSCGGTDQTANALSAPQPTVLTSGTVAGGAVRAQLSGPSVLHGGRAPAEWAPLLEPTQLVDETLNRSGRSMVALTCRGVSGETGIPDIPPGAVRSESAHRKASE